ncbi:MAG: ABC transporter substrate-binding protein [Bacillota bacterium]
MDKKIFLITILIFTFLILNNNQIYGEEKNIITDMAGRNVEIPKKINGIIAAGAGTLRQVIYIDGIDRIKGVEQQEKEEDWYPAYNVAYPELKQLPAIGPQHGGDAELIVSQEPDIIFYRGDTEDAKNLQQKTGIPVISIKLGDFYTNRDVLYEAWEIIGKVLNQKKRAEDLISYTEKQIDILNNKTKDIKEKPTIFAGGISHRGGHGLASTKIPFPPFRFLNMKSKIIEDKYTDVTSIIINREQLLAGNPDYIFIDCENLNLVQKDLEEHPEYQSLQAVKDNNLYGLLPYSIYNRNQENILINTFFIGKTLFPEEFDDINFEEKADKIYDTFLQRSIYHDITDTYSAFKNLDTEL